MSLTSRFSKHLLETKSVFAIICQERFLLHWVCWKEPQIQSPKCVKKKSIQSTLSPVYCDTAPCKTLSLTWSNNFYLWWYTDPIQFQPSAIQFHVTCTLSGQVQCKRQLHKAMIIDGLNFQIIINKMPNYGQVRCPSEPHSHNESIKHKSKNHTIQGC